MKILNKVTPKNNNLKQINFAGLTLNADTGAMTKDWLDFNHVLNTKAVPL